MAVIVTDTRTIISEADANTGGTWSGAAGAFSTATFVEGPNAWVGTLNIATGQIIFTRTTSFNATNQLVYIWTNNYALQGLWDAANPPNAMYLGDGTNNIAFRMAGSNRKMFTHLSNQDWNWDCLIIDTEIAKTYPSTLARNGSLANLNLGALTIFGADMTTLSKGLGGGTNVAVDIIRIGNGGIVITGGTTSTRGKFVEIVVEDRSTANLKAHGIIREYSTNLYGVQGPLTFGASTGNSWFEDSGVTIAFEDRFVANNKYFFNVVGGTGETHFILRNSSITTAGPFVSINMSSNNINTLTITGNTFNALGNGILFANDTAAQSHTVTNNVFQGCGQIDPGKVIFQDNTIASSTAGATGALLIDADGTSNIEDISFISSGTGHAVYITSPGSYTLRGFRFSGYGANNTTNAAIYNNSGGLVTLTMIDSDTATVRNGTGATTEFTLTPYTLTLTGLIPNTEIVVLEHDTQTVLDRIENSGTTFAFDYFYPTGYNIDIVIHNVEYVYIKLKNLSLPENNSSLPIQQVRDRWVIT